MTKKKHLDYEAESDVDDGKNLPKTFEDVLEQIGGFGRFQGLLLLFVLFYEIPSGFLAFVPVFVGGVPAVWHCDFEMDVSDNNLSLSSIVHTTMMTSSEVCTACSNGTRSAPPYTIVAEWDLICSKSWVTASITTIQMFGMFFGNTIPPQISDWYGRKVTFLGLMVLMTVGESVSAVAPNPYVFAVARFICGIGLAGYFSLNGIYTMEFLTPRWRQLGGCLGPLGEGLMILGVLAYFIRPWRLLLWATTFPFVTVLFVYPFLPESPRWLLRQKRYTEAASVLSYIARINGRKLRRRDVAVLKEIGDEESRAAGGGATVRYSYLDLFRRPSIRRKTLIFIGIWFCWAFTYFGLSYNIRNFGVDPYLMTVLMGGVDAIGFRAALLVNNRLGRRKALLAFTGISALFFLPVGFIQLFSPPGAYQSIFIPLILLGKMCVAGARSAVRVLTVESYPVSIRTMGFGVSRVSSTLGGMIAPQIAYLGSKWPSLPLFAFGTLGFLGALLSLLLRETSGKPLEDKLKEDTTGTQDKHKLEDKVNNNNNSSSTTSSGGGGGKGNKVTPLPALLVPDAFKHSNETNKNKKKGDEKRKKSKKKKGRKLRSKSI
ncbi:organic cation transporter protein [Folsomia candida]|uniref:organic cation transporter protein n=1 Tax=Folsomia candida TaxID=158441 RepID=UPI001604CA61|nr:organic cation transporter protein [Folsomia candida]